MTAKSADDPTLAYYEDQAEAFFAETVGVDMAPLYARLLAHVPPGGRILDAGCGSGRDTLAFRRLGYTVTAFEASPTLARMASEHCGLLVEVLRFQEIDWEDRFDGIWACASLLHVPMAELPDVLRRLGRALKADGVLYASFKYGSREREFGGRRFTDLDEQGLAALVDAMPALAVVETWVTGDRREGREGERWLNALVARGSRTSAVYRMSGQPHESSGPAASFDLKARLAARRAASPGARTGPNSSNSRLGARRSDLVRKCLSVALNKVCNARKPVRSHCSDSINRKFSVYKSKKE